METKIFDCTKELFEIYYKTESAFHREPTIPFLLPSNSSTSTTIVESSRNRDSIFIPTRVPDPQEFVDGFNYVVKQLGAEVTVKSLNQFVWPAPEFINQGI